jgi:hypothetical protein
VATGNVFPQYHCVHHDVFTSVTASDESPFDTSEWKNVLAVGHERYWEPLSNEAHQPGSVDIPPDAYSEPTWAPPPPTFPDVRIAHFLLVVREKQSGIAPESHTPQVRVTPDSHTSAAKSKTLQIPAAL